MVKALIDRLDRWLATNRTDYYAHLQPGATDAQLDAFEAQFSLNSPGVLRQLYRWRNGQDMISSEWLMENFMFSSLEGIAASKELMDDKIGSDFEDPGSVLIMRCYLVARLLGRRAGLPSCGASASAPSAELCTAMRQRFRAALSLNDTCARGSAWGGRPQVSLGDSHHRFATGHQRTISTLPGDRSDSDGHGLRRPATVKSQQDNLACWSVL
jgi:hypothetical protein